MTKAGENKPEVNIDHSKFSKEELNLLYFIEKNLKQRKEIMNAKLLVLDGSSLQMVFDMIVKLGKTKFKPRRNLMRDENIVTDIKIQWSSIFDEVNPTEIPTDPWLALAHQNLAWGNCIAGGVLPSTFGIVMSKLCQITKLYLPEECLKKVEEYKIGAEYTI